MSLRILLISVISLVCIAAVLFAGCTGPGTQPPPTPVPATPLAPFPAMSNTFTQADNGKAYSLPLDSIIQLRLPENPSTGFSWSLAVTTGLAVVNDSYVPDDVSGKLVGSGGTHVWFMKAVQPGGQSVAGAYRRPWEPASPDVTFFNLSFVVESTCGPNVCTLPSTPQGVPARYSVYTDTDSGKTVEETLGETFALRLQENPTTGYTWNLSLPKGITLSRDEYLPFSPGGQTVGGGGTRSFTLLAAKAGSWNIAAEYRRPWVASGTVTYQNLEGGFYGILGDDGKKYDPLNLDAKYQRDGLRIAFEATDAKDIVSTRMWGTPVNLDQVEVIPVFRLGVQVG
ncbi:MAG: protease inhibitor I42 family protein [Methanomicrobiales archaeon]|nr:protease inhibitor I42 family protein [Methanomicrobiales archaeon]